ncbi:MAG: glycosyltransferase family 4 protein [Mariprofundaceae bacterium]|nr:glycosyltransferase family 4 protein [Mariprofundaceae bacterium]
MNILQVVRRFGPVGGMERYVWELARELALAGHRVQVLCEANLSSELLPGVRIHTLGTIRPKPRWLSHIRFSNRVHAWLKQNRQADMIIHSHERLQDHHITTFHGPPFAQIKDQPIWKRLSLRAGMNLWLEQRELCAPQVQTVVPNSVRIAEQLRGCYPAVEKRLSRPIVPGVNPCPGRTERVIAADAGVIGFVGKEWRRKGLEMAINIVSKLAEARPDLRFMVAGPAREAIEHLFEPVTFHYTLLGEVDARPLYSQFDLLLHPARKEPFGMVITEALSAGVPVLISDVCGAVTEVTALNGSTLSLDDPIGDWVDAADHWLSHPVDTIGYDRNWREVALEYEHLYKHIRL